jgi:hypothetical protein
VSGALFCSYCGAPTPGQGGFCPRCGQRREVLDAEGPPTAPHWTGAPPSVAAWATPPVLTRATVPGDWVGALLAIAAGVAAMVVLPLVLLLVAGVQHVSADSLPALTAILVALGVGGSVDISVGPTASTVAFLPLMVSVVGFTTIAVVFALRLRTHQTPALRDAALQAVRVLGVFAVALLAISAVGRLKLRGDTSLLGNIVAAAGLSANITILRTVIVGLLLLGATLTVTIGIALPQLTPVAVAARWRRVQGAVEGVATAGGFIIAVALVVALVELIVHRDVGIVQSAFGSSDTSPAGLSIVVFVMVLPNLALAAVAATFGAPAGSYGPTGSNHSGSVLTQLGTDRQSWAVVALALAAVVLGGAVAARRTTSRTQALKTGWVMGPVLAITLFAIALLTDASITFDSGSAFSSFGVSGSVGVNFNYWAAPLLGLAWGAVGGLLGAACAPLARWRAPNGGAAAPQPPSQSERTAGAVTAAVVFLACIGVAVWGLLPQGAPTATASPTSTSQPNPSRTTTATPTPRTTPYSPTPSFTPTLPPQPALVQVDSTVSPTTAAAVQPLFTRYYSAINTKDFATWSTTVTSSRLKEQSETQWRQGYQSTQISNVTITSVTAGNGDGSRVSVTFTSTQDVAEAPPDLKVPRICWSLVTTVVYLGGPQQVIGSQVPGSVTKTAC